MGKCQIGANQCTFSSCGCLSIDDHNATGDHDCDNRGCHDEHEFGAGCINLECYDGPRGRHHHHLSNDWSFTLAWWRCDDIDYSCFQLKHHGGACFLEHDFRAKRQRDHIIATYHGDFDIDDRPDTVHHHH